MRRRISLKIDGLNRVFNFKIRNDCEYEGWRENLENFIAKSEGALYNLKFEDCMKEVLSGYKFWRFVR